MPAGEITPIVSGWVCTGILLKQRRESNKLMSDQESRFKNLLDENYCWPCAFPFKFIIPAERLENVLALFPGEEYTSRP
ncbi:MAG: hypothetical protein JW902_04765, partial [Syntrophaceae bacterium]|nr:hypothetical protein [Syntrophaceae bacterium]